MELTQPTRQQFNFVKHLKDSRCLYAYYPVGATFVFVVRMGWQVRKVRRVVVAKDKRGICFLIMIGIGDLHECGLSFHQLTYVKLRFIGKCDYPANEADGHTTRIEVYLVCADVWRTTHPRSSDSKYCSTNPCLAQCTALFG